MAATNIYEERYRRIHSAPILSGTYPSAMEAGGDLYGDYTAKYNNSSVNALGLGTVVDCLAAIRKLVYEDKAMTLPELTAILRQNWEGQEALRLRIKRKFPKYGLGDPAVDALAARIVDHLHGEVSGKPNPRGGVYRLGLFSINWRWEFGKYTAASADGRKHGETISQNTGAAFGSDRDGATAHLLSVSAIDSLKVPNGAMADIDLHRSAVQGENGIAALTATLRTYFARGGFGVHYNVLNTETLKEARRDPAAHPNLQVRLCGWNVLFSSLSEKEKDEFIARSERG
jgi:formate C-acetyltransferase